MMARKLSVVARRAARFSIGGVAVMSACLVFAEGDVHVSEPSNVVSNPFVATKTELKPRIVSEEPQPVARGPITYQNPFANSSKAPPIDTSLRPGPASRWQHPNIPSKAPSAI